MNENLEYFEHQDCCDDYKSIVEKFLTICIPVKTTPNVKVGKIKTECCGNPIISAKRPEKCYNDKEDDGSCKFTIIQKMKIEIPIDFDACTKIDDLLVDCEFKYDKHDKYGKDEKYDKDNEYDKEDKYDKYDKHDKDDKTDKYYEHGKDDKYDDYNKDEKCDC